MTRVDDYDRGWPEAVEADEAALELLYGDEIMARLIDERGNYRWALRPPFESLARAITGQQISMAAARTIYGRVQALAPITPDGLGAVSDEQLQRCGMSRAKVVAVRGLVDAARSGHLEGLAQLDDAGARLRLMELRGVGPWTAEMTLIFCLGRKDVWSYLDAGLLRAARLLYGASDAQAFNALGERFTPYRSAAAWYLWRSLESPPSSARSTVLRQPPRR